MGQLTIFDLHDHLHPHLTHLLCGMLFLLLAVLDCLEMLRNRAKKLALNALLHQCHHVNKHSEDHVNITHSTKFLETQAIGHSRVEVGLGEYGIHPRIDILHDRQPLREFDLSRSTFEPFSDEKQRELMHLIIQDGGLDSIPGRWSSPPPSFLLRLLGVLRILSRLHLRLRLWDLGIRSRRGHDEEKG